MKNMLLQKVKSMQVKPYKKYWRWFENAVFIYAFFRFSWDSIYGPFMYYIINPLFGKGVDEKGNVVNDIVIDVKDQFNKHTYYDTFITIILVFVSIITIWEISRLVYEGIKSANQVSFGFKKVKGIFNCIAKTFKATFLATLVGFYLQLLIKLDVFNLVKPFFNSLSLFKINYEWYSWIYAYLVWELSTWVWHEFFP